MALEPIIELRENNGSFYFIDVTGLYDADVNPTGWGSPNATRASITRILITITDPTGSVSTYDTDNSTLILAKLTSAGTTSFNVILHKEDLTFIDGAYEISYSVFVSATEYNYSDTIYYLENIKSCIYRKYASIITDDCCVENGKLMEAHKYWAMYKSIQFNAAGGTITEADYTLSKLQKWCGCSC